MDLGKGIHDFLKPKPDCLTGKENTSEDCLYLNIYKPSNVNPDSLLPVLVWIFGGGFTQGRIGLYNGTELAVRENVIIVTPSYRVGAFGFLATESTLTESGSTGNWGIQDQRMALLWVQRFIESFGGNKDRVLLFGQSAGAMSVATHLVSPQSRGLFHAAILSSASAQSSYFYRPLEDSYKFAEWFAVSVARCKNRNDIDCLRSVAPNRLVISSHHRDHQAPDWASRIFPLMPWGITIDKFVLDDTPLKLAQQGLIVNKVPVIIGVVADEGSVFGSVLNQMIRPKVSKGLHIKDIPRITSHLLGDHDGKPAKLIRDLYPRYVEMFPPKAPTSDPSAESDTRRLSLEEIRPLDISETSLTELRDIFDALEGLNHGTAGQESPAREAPVEFFNDILSESVFTCSSMDFGLSLAKQAPVWFYYFDIDVWKGTPWDRTPTKSLSPEGNDLPLSSLGAFHGSEIPFIWNMFPDSHALPGDISNANTIFTTFTAPAFCPEDSFKRKIANQFGCFWTNLIKCNSPQCSGTSCVEDFRWHPYSMEEPNILIFDKDGSIYTRSLSQTGMRPLETSFLPTIEQCASWNQRNITFCDLREHGLDAVYPQMKFAAQTSLGKSARSSSYSAMILIVAVGVMIL